jgi:RNA polymerase subunit RPABC4/transcription elongation factor Spt4
MFELAKQVAVLSLVHAAREYEYRPTFMFLERAIAVALGLLWLGITGYILWQYVIKPRRPGGEKHRRNRSHRQPGKRCPQCQNLINAGRTVCQHCGYAFGSAPPEEESPTTPDAQPAGSHHPTTDEPATGSHHRSKRGKYCPQCHKMISRERTTCQFCGYVFFEAKELPSSKPETPRASGGDEI